MTAETTEGLVCPRDHGALQAVEGELSCAAGHRFPLRRWAGGAFADFSDETTFDSNAALQRATYDDGQANRYSGQGQDDKARFMRDFVSRRVRGRVKAKEQLLLSAFRDLRLPPAPRLLEIGCNDGRYLFVASALSGGSGSGLDISAAAVQQALEARPRGDRNAFHVGQADRLPVGDGSVDCVLSFDVFEHLGQGGFEQAMREVARVLAPGGALLVYVVSQNDRFTLHETLRQISGGRVGVDDGEGHRWENFIHPDRFRAVAAEVGLSVARLRAYHGFWTLFAEYYLYNAPPAFAYRLLDLLDYPLWRFDHGNGFLAVARKESP